MAKARKPKADNRSLRAAIEKVIGKPSKVSDRDKQALIDAIERDMESLKRGRSVSRDAEARAEMLRRHHAALARHYNYPLPPPELPADVSESVAYLRSLHRFLKPRVNPNAAQEEAQAKWLWQHHYDGDVLKVHFDIGRISEAAKELAWVLRWRCPIVGQPFPFDHINSDARNDVHTAADCLGMLLDARFPRAPAYHLNALRAFGHPQRAAVVPLFRIWDALHEGVAEPLAEARKGDWPSKLPDIEQATIDALEQAANELDELIAAKVDDKVENESANQDQPPATGAGEQGEGKTLSPSRAKAYGQYLHAVGRNPELANATDREVYNAVKEQLDSGETLPTYATWTKYVRDARAHHDANKHRSRAGRPHGKSVVRRDQI